MANAKETENYVNQEEQIREEDIQKILKEN